MCYVLYVCLEYYTVKRAESWIVTEFVCECEFQI